MGLIDIVLFGTQTIITCMLCVFVGVSIVLLSIGEINSNIEKLSLTVSNTLRKVGGGGAKKRLVRALRAQHIILLVQYYSNIY